MDGDVITSYSIHYTKLYDFIGLITMLALLDDPERIGAGMALALITFLYGLFFNMAVAIPFRTGLEKKLKEII